MDLINLRSMKGITNYYLKNEFWTRKHKFLFKNENVDCKIMKDRITILTTKIWPNVIDKIKNKSFFLICKNKQLPVTYHANHNA